MPLCPEPETHEQCTECGKYRFIGELIYGLCRSCYTAAVLADEIHDEQEDARDD